MLLIPSNVNITIKPAEYNRASPRGHGVNQAFLPDDTGKRGWDVNPPRSVRASADSQAGTPHNHAKNVNNNPHANKNKIRWRTDN